MLADSPTDKSSSPSKEQLCPNDNCSLNSSQDFDPPEEVSAIGVRSRIAAGADFGSKRGPSQSLQNARKCPTPADIIKANGGRDVDSVAKFLFIIPSREILKKMSLANSLSGMLLSDLELDELSMSYNKCAAQQFTPTAQMKNVWTELQRNELDAINRKDHFAYARVLELHEHELSQLINLEKNARMIADQDEALKQRLREVIRNSLWIFDEGVARDGNLRHHLWNEHRELFPLRIRTHAAMPEHAWKQVLHFIDEKEGEMFNEVLDQIEDVSADFIPFRQTPYTFMRHFLTPVDRVQYGGNEHPQMNPKFVEIVLFFSPTSIVKLAHLWTRRWRGPNFTLAMAREQLAAAVSRMNAHVLKHIYIIVRLVDSIRDMRPPVLHERLLCFYCSDRGSHYTNECVRNYTQEMRTRSLTASGTCRVCRQRNGHTSHMGICCNHCTHQHLHSFCDSPEMWTCYHRRFYEIWMVYSATLGWTAMDWERLFDNLIRLADRFPGCPNSDQYRFIRNQLSLENSSQPMSVPLKHEYENEFRQALLTHNQIR